MLIYLDMCCLKRPFDDQLQPRIRLESEAVLSLLARESDQIQFLRTPALKLENSRNPVLDRALRVENWILSRPLLEPDLSPLQSRTESLMKLGLKTFDALHVASAELARADFMATCDDRLIAAARRNEDALTIKVAGVIEVAREVLK